MKAIETRYKGYRFRSRLEARWGVFFDALGLDWEYEPEGYDLGSAGWYLPDFLIHFENQTCCWFEVKGKKATKTDLEKAQSLADYTNTHCFVASGTMGVPDAVFSKRGWKKGKAEKFEGAKIFERIPSCRWVHGEKSDTQTKKIAQQYANSRICAFFEDAEGNFAIDHLYLTDTDKSPKIDDVGQDNGVPFATIEAADSKKDTGKTLVTKLSEDLTTELAINFGAGRFYRSKALRRAYQKARSARFEHGETP